MENLLVHCSRQVFLLLVYWSVQVKFMESEKKRQVIDYVNQQIQNSGVRTAGYVFDMTGEKRHPNRNCFIVLRGYLKNYMKKISDSRLFILYGLRGTGKTTLISQLYDEISHIPKERKLFLSLDEITLMGVTLKDVLGVYEEVLESSFENLSEPVFLFLDEVHFDDGWFILLKTIFDRSKNVFIVATGSSALSLQMTPDLTRRAIFIKLYPMQFTEYIKIRDNKFEKKGLAQEIRRIVFNSDNALDAYNLLQKIKPRVKDYWSGLERADIDSYLEYGTFPSTVFMPSSAVAHDQIKKTLEQVVSVDIPHIEKFSSEIISKIPSILYMLSSTDQCSLNSMSESIDINRQTLTSVLDTLEKTETIWRLFPYGSHYRQARKSSKYLFTSPAFRSMYFNLTEDVSTHDDFKGKVLEDAVGLTLRRLFFEKPGFSITYDASKGGADFIVCYSGKVFVVEVGYGNKNISQISKTMERVRGYNSFGILVSQNPLGVYPEENIIGVPVSYFLLI